MKQGSASRDVTEGGKREPISYGVSVQSVSRLGQMIGNKVEDGPLVKNLTDPIHAKRGFSAPMDKGNEVFPCGSQRGK